MSNADAREDLQEKALFEIPAGTQITPEYLFARYTQTIVDLRAQLASARDLSWFWEIVDKNGLSNVPSSEGDALRKLVRDSAILDGLRARLGGVGEGDGQFTLESTFQALLNVTDFNVELDGKLTAAIEERDRLARQNARLKEIVRYFTGPYDKGCAYSAIESDPQTMGSRLLIKAGFLDDLLEEIEQFD